MESLSTGKFSASPDDPSPATAPAEPEPQA
jgi:hypothetical protein